MGLTRRILDEAVLWVFSVVFDLAVAVLRRLR
jgi:hypothetical protein